uniref:Ion transport domain-containing protein n=1 Tax=Aureoumbra lagunensis TaxID=44058 RepID=A0A7S3NIN9_9STRA|eukprot:CAMPEP_0197296384 /NCGR_PEP_ID=MMETSP0890-20130614/38268_1 /TAXON_ID=44058 ORGANISM="Aureoumbra lagunensis, Strain CCMP1510" /NCGR_SAMPLE_ID=MMETSP0890 /ASSEMBLY_ACC=CAM_ASM_000533 /LENGTH=851 /DNA_ID=CAMNT_0042772913 /DNA_START=66 /DNA_END=2621 /DNA_ORIENTATION=+
MNNEKDDEEEESREEAVEFDYVKNDDENSPPLVFNDDERHVFEDRAYDFFSQSQIDWLEKNVDTQNDGCVESRSQIGKCYLEYHLKSEDMVKKMTKDISLGRNWIVVNHDGYFRRYWDYLSILFTLFLCIYEPYICAFLTNHRNDVLDAYRGQKTKNHTLVIIIRIFSTTWFSCDLLINCITSYTRRDGKRVIGLVPVFKNYIKTWFVLDVLTTVPWETMILAACRTKCQNRRGIAFFLDLIPIARAFKLSKFVKAREHYDASPDLSEILCLPPFVETLFWALFAALLLNHLFGCLWYAIGYRFRILNYDLLCAAQNAPIEGIELTSRTGKIAREKCTWMQLYGLQPSKQSRIYLYTLCFYWSLTTVSTVGYGDLTPNTPLEMIYTGIVMLAGVSWFAVLVSSVGDEVTANDNGTDSASMRNGQQQNNSIPHLGFSKAKQKRMKRSLKAFMYKHHVDIELSSAINAYLRRHFEIDQPWIDEEEFPDLAQLIQQLNKPLLRALALHIFKEKTKDTHIPFFLTKPSDFIADCVIAMRSYMAGPAETLVHKGTILRALHLIITGVALADRISDDTEFSSSSTDKKTTQEENRQDTSKRRRASNGFTQNLLSLIVKSTRTFRAVNDEENQQNKPTRWQSMASSILSTSYVASIDETTQHGDPAINKIQQQIQKDRFWRLDSGEYYGEEGICLGAVWLKPLFAVCWCELMIIPDSALHLSEHRTVQHGLRASANEKIKRGGSHLFYVQPAFSSQNISTSSKHIERGGFRSDSFSSQRIHSANLDAFSSGQIESPKNPKYQISIERLQDTLTILQNQIDTLQTQINSSATNKSVSFNDATTNIEQQENIPFFQSSCY